jgi:hypothetical protein
VFARVAPADIGVSHLALQSSRTKTQLPAFPNSKSACLRCTPPLSCFCALFTFDTHFTSCKTTLPVAAPCEKRVENREGNILYLHFLCCGSAGTRRVHRKVYRDTVRLAAYGRRTLCMIINHPIKCTSVGLLAYQNKRATHRSGRSCASL